MRTLVGTSYGRTQRLLPILMLHQVLARPDPLRPEVPHIGIVARQLEALASFFTVLPLVDAVAQLRDGTLPHKAACITFDDGYRDNLDVALPLLQRHRLPATVFVATGPLDGGIMFNDLIIESVRLLPAGVHDFGRHGLGQVQVGDTASRLALIRALTAAAKYRPLQDRDVLMDDLCSRVRGEIPRDLMLTRDQVRTLSRQGVAIGGHTVNHPILTQLASADALAEIIRNRDQLRDITDTMPRAFAYPNGKPNRDYTAEHARMVEQAGYDVAVSTAAAVATTSSHRFQLPRFVATSQTITGVIGEMWKMARHRNGALAS